jgi:hypothetical protein
MSTHAIINTIRIARLMTIGKLEAIDEELFDVQPPQFNNTVRWNAGHLVSTLDALTFQRIAQTSKIPAGFADFFKGGTKPSDWTVNPPSKAELLELLKKQLDDLIDAFGEKAEEALPSPLQIRDFKLQTVGDVIGFAVIHESLHSTVISDLLKVIGQQQS